MIKQTPDECMGTQPLWRKAIVALSVLANPWMLLLDKFGLVARPTYKTKTGVVFETRGKTTDINDAVVVLSGNEYPQELLGLSGTTRPVVIDCGGHIGTFSLYVKNLYPQANIVIFEPVEANRVLLKKNIAANSALSENITILPIGLYSESGQFYVDLSGKQFDAVSLQREKPAHSEYISTEAITFNQLVEQQRLNVVDLMKLDVEGAEYPILRESVGDISKVVKRLIMEYHPAGDKARRDEIVNNLTSHNWELVYETKNILGFANSNLK